MTSLLEAEVQVAGRLALTNLTVSGGARVAVIGPNGSGKTSLLRALAGIDGTGNVRVAGEAIADAPAPRRRHLLSYLPASRDLAWPIPVRDVIALGLDAPDAERVSELMALLQLEALAERAIDTLSTGERARALLGRALAPRPKLLLLDEPLSNLDPAWALRTFDLLKTIDTTVLLALHDLALLGRFERVLLMDQGAIVADGSPAELLASPIFAQVFGIEPDGSGWTLRSAAGPRSSP